MAHANNKLHSSEVLRNPIVVQNNLSFRHEIRANFDLFTPFQYPVRILQQKKGINIAKTILENIMVKATGRLKAELFN